MNSSPDRKEYFQSVIDDLRNKPDSEAFKGTIHLEFGAKLDFIKLDKNNLVNFN
jgi:hypothetical protein